MYDHLQKWGPRKQEVKFFLRHEDSPTESSDQGAYYRILIHLERFLTPFVQQEPWELKLRETCQSLVSFPFSLWEILHALNLGIFAILSSLHLHITFWFPQAPRSPAMLLRDPTKPLFNVSFLKDVGQNNLYGYPLVHRINVYLFGFVLGAWPHKKKACWNMSASLKSVSGCSCAWDQWPDWAHFNGDYI